MGSYTKALIDGNYKVNLEEELGKGSFSSVYPGMVSNTGEKVAVKKIQYKNKEHINREHLESCLKELEAFRRIQHHKNIVKLFDHEKDDTNYWFVMELCNCGDLQSYLKCNHVTFNAKVKIMIECASAIKYVHSLISPIVHRDIKLTNIMIMRNGTEVIAKVADFGIGKLFNKTGPETLHMHTMCGTSSFMAPEFFTQETGKENPTYGPEVDIFALGLVFQVLLLYGKDPGMQYDCPLSVDLRDARTNPIYSFGSDMVNCKQENKPLPKLFHQCENDKPEESNVKQIITSMTEYEAKDRMNLEDVVQSLTEIKSSKKRVQKLIDIIDDGEKKKAVLNKATLRSLSSKEFLNQEVVVVSMIGMYRSGKSSLLNMWSGLGKKGFKTKGGEEACTSGVWIYCLQQQNKTIVLLDSQGTGDVFNTENDTDVWISLFSVLVCSVLVFNQPKNINDSLFRNLYTMVAHANSYSEVWNAPELCVLIRDYTLGPFEVKENSSLEKYFQDDIPEDRNIIKDFFKRRCCFIMGMPTAEPWSVDDWSFHNPDILKKYKDGAHLIWEYLTTEASTFKPAERTFSFKEWIDLVPSIVENMDLALSVLKPEGEKLNMYLTADDRRRNAYKTQKKCFRDKVSRIEILTKSWELPCEAETCMHPITQINEQIQEYHKENMKKLTLHTNGKKTTHIDKYENYLGKVKMKVKIVYDHLKDMSLCLVGERNMVNFGHFLRNKLPNYQREILLAERFCKSYILLQNTVPFYPVSGKQKYQNSSYDSLFCEEKVFDIENASNIDAEGKQHDHMISEATTISETESITSEGRHDEDISGNNNYPNNSTSIDVYHSANKRASTEQDRLSRSSSADLEKIKNDESKKAVEKSKILEKGYKIEASESIDSFLKHLEHFLQEQVPSNKDFASDILQSFQTFFHGDNLRGFDVILSDDHCNEWDQWMKDLVICNLVGAVDRAVQNQFQPAVDALKDCSDRKRENKPIHVQIMNSLEKTIEESTPECKKIYKRYFETSLNCHNAKILLEKNKEVLPKNEKENNISKIFISSSLGILTIISATGMVVIPLLLPVTVLLGSLTVGSLGLSKLIDDRALKIFTKNTNSIVKYQHKTSKAILEELKNVLEQCSLEVPENQNETQENVRFFQDILTHYSKNDADASIDGLIEKLEKDLSSNFLPLERVEPIMKYVYYKLLQCALKGTCPDKYEQYKVVRENMCPKPHVLVSYETTV